VTMWWLCPRASSALRRAMPHAQRFASASFQAKAGEKQMEGGGDMKVNKMMVHLQLCSRREANDYIKRGLVMVDGQVASLGQVVGAQQSVILVPAAAAEQGKKLSIMLHKPAGWVSQNSDASGAERQRLAVKLLTWHNQSRPLKASRTQGLAGVEGDECVLEEQGEPCQMRGLAVVGRLDAQSRGLLLFTQVP